MKLPPCTITTAGRSAVPAPAHSATHSENAFSEKLSRATLSLSYRMRGGTASLEQERKKERKKGKTLGETNATHPLSIASLKKKKKEGEKREEKEGKKENKKKENKKKEIRKEQRRTGVARTRPGGGGSLVRPHQMIEVQQQPLRLVDGGVPLSLPHPDLCKIRQLPLDCHCNSGINSQY